MTKMDALLIFCGMLCAGALTIMMVVMVVFMKVGRALEQLERPMVPEVPCQSCGSTDGMHYDINGDKKYHCCRRGELMNGEKDEGEK